ncbi:MAG: DNRLRE domain-containing protein, partial [Phycisphaerae bacterium]|nr:DNRLRE domain-containing protein [Phycisphaerae bacterium]
MKLINCFRTWGGLTFLALVVILTGQLSKAEHVILESATMGPTGQVEGYLVDYSQYIGARFYVDRRLEVTQIGGHIAQAIFGADFFGAIVSLSGPSDLPDGYPFTYSEVVASTVFDPGYFSSDFRTPLSVELNPGYYALVFGTDTLGSANGYGIMPYLGQTSFPSASYFVFWPGYGWGNVPSNDTRFVIEGNTKYCDASGSDYLEWQYIKGVQVGTINNIPTGNNHYADYTSLSTTMIPEISYPLTITRGNPWDDVYDKCGAWVDWNWDKDFSDLGEQITMSLGADPCTFTGTITPPAGIDPGDTRLRVRIAWNEVPQPCGGSNYGEVEDYTITIAGDAGGISGIIFNDLNGNGVLNGGEPGLAGWEIYLDLNNNGQLDTGERNTITGPDGSYEFSSLVADTYTVAEVMQAGWKQTYPAVGGAHSVTVTEGATTENINFGNWQSGGNVVYLKAIEDTYADSSSPEANYGSENEFYSGKDGSSICRAYLKFDISSIPPGQVMTSAKLRLNNNYITNPGPELVVDRVIDKWDESTVTWNYQPIGGSSDPMAVNKEYVYGDTTVWDVTDDVDDDYVYDGFCSLRITSFDEGLDRDASFWSKDSGNPHLAPTLEVEYAPIFGGGTGEPNDPYQIRTGEQFNRIGLYSNRWRKHYKLMDNISLA